MIDIHLEVENEVYQEPLFEDPMAYNDMSMCGITETQLAEYDQK